ncbi:CHAT domain-containing protein [Mycena galericulata]|nr:CHAT domain-containing protein [Mycena galericulata]
MHQLYRASFQTQAPPQNSESAWRAALSWAQFTLEFQDTHLPDAYLAAFQLLPDILWIGHKSPEDIIRRIRLPEATSRAIRACIRASNVTVAIELLEQGIGTIFQQILQIKPDRRELPPGHAKKLQELSSKLDSQTYDGPSEFYRQRKELLEDIRSHPGLENFLQIKPYKALSHASQGGPVIILSSHTDGSDVFIILNPTSEPVHLEFPNVSSHELTTQRQLLMDVLGNCNVRRRGDSGSTRLYANREGFKTVDQCFAELLAWLWIEVVKPVYETLKSVRVNIDSPNVTNLDRQHGITHGRLWWLPTGAFSGLPLHACSPTTQFIHSYTATLVSLLDAYTKKPSNNPPKMTVVAVTHTGPGGANYLKGVRQEARNICSVVSGNLQCLEGEQATPEAVQLHLQDCSWAHLACHGKQDLNTPTTSHLLLYGGKLALHEILKMPLPSAECVFLAACQTAMGDTELINESFHLSGGFIAAGFRGAIGTLWSMNDADGPVVAKSVYSQLFKDGRQPQASDAAQALHLAVEKLKAGNVSYERWIPFIHMGI